MVNTGKPSGACGVCRERRIKCDETKPTCLKCTRSGRTCSGYAHGLKLRDQTQKTIIKARLGKPRTKAQQHQHQQRRSTTEQRAATKSPRTPTSSVVVDVVDGGEATPRDKAAKVRSFSLPALGAAWATNGHGGLVVKARKKSVAAAQQESWSFAWQIDEDALVDPLLWQTIDTPVVEQARCYFLSSYVVYDPRGPAEGMFTFIPSLLATNDAGKEHFEDLFSAVSIAAFSMRPNAAHAAAFGRLYYGRGVTTLRKALGDKVLARSDAALASTILLGFYEGIVNEGIGIVSYNPHFKGAITLLRMREEEQFSSKHSTEMFDFVMQILMRQYALSLTCSDEDVRRWAVQASLRPKQQRPHLTAMYVGHLRQKVARLLKTDERSAKTVQEAMAILGTAQKFERMVTQRFEAEATELRGERVASSPLADPARGTTTLVYSDWWTAARSLNKYAFRLLLCHIIADMSDWLGEGPVNANAEADANANANANTQSPEDPGAKAANIAKQDIESIITSIPYLCTWEEGKSRGASSPCGRNDLVSTQGITSLLVIWPLYLAGDSRFATAEQKEYIQHKLAWMADNRGVRHALGVSKYLKLQAATQDSPSSAP